MNTDEFVRDYWQSIDALDMDRFLAFFAPDCTMGFGSYPLVHGLSGVRGMIAPVFAGVAGMRHQRLGLWSHEDATVARGEVTYTRHDRSTVTIPFMTHFEFAEGRIRSTHVYIDIAPLYAGGSGG
jgi:ketosteroid isomerase-like protein